MEVIHAHADGEKLVQRRDGMGSEEARVKPRVRWCVWE
jgi:hypothetical protein